MTDLRLLFCRARLAALLLAAVGAGAAWAQPGPQARASAPAPVASASAVAASAPASAASAAAPSSAGAMQPADYIVAIVNNEPITNSEVRAGVETAEENARANNLPLPPIDELRQTVRESLITERALLQYARQQGLKVSDEDLAQAELTIARRNNLSGIEELERTVQANGIEIKAYRDNLRNQVLSQKLLQQEIGPKVTVSDAEVDAYLRQNTNAHIGETMLNLAMILVAVPENASPEETERLQARAQEVARRAQSGEDFAKLAAEYSDANGHDANGGVLGLRPISQYSPLFVQSTSGARVGDIVGPIKSGAGYHILKVLERKQNDQLVDAKIQQTHVRQILLKISPSQSESVARERLIDFKRRILAGQATFEDLARANSQDSGSAADGGDLGWAIPGQFVPEFERAMNNLNVGQISDPITTRYGVHLIEVEGRRETMLAPDEQRPMARSVLFQKKEEEAFDTWAKEVRGRAYIEYRDPPS